MVRFFALTTGVIGAITVAVPASACLPPVPEPRLAGESDLAYQARVEKMSREYEEQRSSRRQQSALSAPILFIAREASTDFYRQEAEKWAASQPKPKPGEPPVPPPPPQVPIPLYFQPVTWIKGMGAPEIFRIETRRTCGSYSSLGDTRSTGEGTDFLFSAREGPISENTLIDAIAIDMITEPELVKLVAAYR